MNFITGLGLLGLMIGGVACMAGELLTGLINVIVGLYLLDIGDK